MVTLTLIRTKIKIRLVWTRQKNGVLMLFVGVAIRRMPGTNNSVSAIKAKNTALRVLIMQGKVSRAWIRS